MTPHIRKTVRVISKNKFKINVIDKHGQHHDLPTPSPDVRSCC